MTIPLRFFMKMIQLVIVCRVIYIRTKHEASFIFYNILKLYYKTKFSIFGEMPIFKIMYTKYVYV